MGLRYRKRVKIAPGIYLNFSKSGVSTTIGPRGASVNFGRNGTYVNAGIPGTGLYMRERVGSNKKLQSQLTESALNNKTSGGGSGIIVIVLIFIVSVICMIASYNFLFYYIGVIPFVLLIAFLIFGIIYCLVILNKSEKNQQPQQEKVIIKTENNAVSEEKQDNTEKDHDNIGNLNTHKEIIKDVEIDQIINTSLSGNINNELENKEDYSDINTLYDPRLELPYYRYPTLDLLENTDNSPSCSSIEELNASKERIIIVLRSFGVEISTIRATVGPIITTYEITLAEGTFMRQICNLEDDLALALAVKVVRIVPIPNRGTIGIEIPNNKPGIVSMLSVLSSKTFQESKMELPCAIGKTQMNEIFMMDLTKAPHLLVAGSTGQGKSVFIDAIITSLLYKKHPSELKFVLIDSRRVQLGLYESIENQFLAKLEDANASIVTDTQSAIETLNALCTLVEGRFNALRAACVRNIQEYNEKFNARQLSPLKGFEYMPYYVVIIDEYGDLIMTEKEGFEQPIYHLAKLGRAVGVHLIISTQRPTANIITGEIKENFPVRVAFKVPSSVDSHVILDMPGANKLLGQGDMLYLRAEDPIRLQGAYIDTSEVLRICQHIQAQQQFSYRTYLPSSSMLYDEDNRAKDVDLNNLDPMFADAARMIVSNQAGSTSMIQRQLSIGYNRAGKLMDQLEAAGVVGPQIGAKPREVLIQNLFTLDTLLIKLGCRDY